MLEVIKKLCGYSLAELLIALSIITLVSAIALPSMGQMIRDSENTKNLNQMLGAIGFARSTAVFSGGGTILCTGSAECSTTALWTGGLIVFHDLNGNGQVEPGEPALRNELILSGYSWHWKSFRKLPHIIYEPDGTSRASNGTLTLCFEGQPQRQIIVSLSGRVRHQNPDGGASCS